MKRLLETQLFSMLSNSLTKKESVDYTQLSVAYDDFAFQLFSFCRNESDLLLLCFVINYTIAELKALHMQFKRLDESIGILIFIVKTLEILNSAYRIIKLRLEKPELFQNNETESFLSEVYLSDDVDFIDIMEVICGLFYSHSLKTKTGNPVNFSDVARIFEKGLNFTFTDIYKKRDDVFKRKSAKLTEFLNELIVAIKIESKNRGYL